MPRPLEPDRFWSYVVKGPAPEDCWLWTGAIADDGYGRFWTIRAGRQRTVRPQRYAYTAVTGAALHPAVMILHRCDIPLCVHAAVDPARSHLRPGTAHDNMQDRARRGRNPNRFTTLRFADLPRAERAARSRALRDSLRQQGWNAEAIHSILAGAGPAHPTLW